MSDSNSVDQGTKDAAREAAGSGQDIRELVRDITLKALTERRLDKERIKTVIKSVTDGVVEGVGENKEKLQSSLKQAASGMDDALSKSAEAAKLATLEALGKASDFADNEFKEALKQLDGLEDLFIDTINKTAEQTSRLANESLKDLASHLKNTGTDAGRTAKEAVDTLTVDVSKLGKDAAKASVGASKEMGKQIADIASGILSGMADALKRKD